MEGGHLQSLDLSFVLLLLGEEEEEPGGLVLIQKQEMVLPRREGWVRLGPGPGEPTACHGFPSREALAGKQKGTCR